jgi:hypothetical protein
MLLRPGSVGRPGQPARSVQQWALDATGESIRAAIADISKYGYSPHNLYTGDSSNFATWTANGATVTANSVTAPDGTQTADLVTRTGANGRIFIQGNITAPAVCTASLYLKKVVGSTVRFDLVNIANSATEFNFDTGVVTLVFPFTGSSVEVISNGWFRVSLRFLLTTPTACVGLYLQNLSDAYAAWGYQVNLGPTALTYVPTTSAAVGPTTPGFLLPGTAGARNNAAARSSVALQRTGDGTYEYAPHNLLLNSEAFASNWTAGAGVTLTDNTVASPRGDMTAATVSWSGAAVTTGFYRVSSVNPAGVANTKSIWVRADAAGGTIDIVDPGTTVGVLVHTLTTTWTRISLSEAAGAQPTSGGLWVRKTASSPATIYVWGGQFSLGALCAYIPTTSAAVYAPAVSHDGTAYDVQCEPSRTNLCLWNADMSNAAWVAASGATKVGAATALGAVPMYRLNVGSTAGSSFVYQTNLPLAASTLYTQLVLVRAVSGTSAFRLAYYDNVSGWRYSGDLLATTTPQILRVEFTTAVGTTIGQTAVAPATAGGTVGDIEVGGFSVIAGSVPATESLILTYGATASRGAQTYDLVGHGLTSTEGTILVDVIPAVVTTAPIYVGHSTGSTAALTADATNNYHWNGSTAYGPGIGSVANAINKLAIAWSGGTRTVAGGGIAGDNASAIGTMNALRLGASGQGNGSQDLSGRIRRLRISNKRLSNAALQGLTA